MQFDNNSTLKRKKFLFIAYVLSVLAAIIVVISGGTYNVYTNVAYIPIALASSTNGKIQGVIHAVITGLIIGFLVPMIELPNRIIMQSHFNGIIRIFFYAAIAFVIGYFSEESYEEHKKNIDNEKEIYDEQIAMIFALVKLSESRDDYSDKHIERVGYLCKFIAYKLSNESGYSDYVTKEYIETIFKASQLHDIGKVGIPDKVLLKPGKLTEEEFAIMKNHTIIGADTIHEVQEKYPSNKFLSMAINIAKSHHEKWDGTGYPEGLSGEDIPLSARIMAIVDVYDALRTKRVYKDAYSHDQSINMIKQEEGTHFDPSICKVFFENQDEIKNIYEKLISYEANAKVSKKGN
ncbi:MAG: HD domain-containing protein [Candidatus Metalachnospira sp.]|nr:HD domain-containing protein [Candidatus Metalachnospira sp.]